MNSIESRPMFSNRALVSLSVPIVIDAVLAIFTGMVDTAMVSTAGEAAVGAISLMDQLFLLLVTIFSAIASGGVVITAQYIGSGDLKKARTSANQLLYASTAIALFILLAAIGFIPQIIRLVYGNLETAVFENARDYFFYALLGMPFLAMANACTALLRTMQRSKLAMLLALGANVINIIGNAILIYGFKMGAAGAAIATTFSRIIWAAVTMYFMHKKSLPVYFEKLLKFRLDFDIMGRVMKIGSANGLESGLFQVGKLLVASLISSFGTLAIAANSVANTLCNIGWTIVGSFGTVLLTVVGQCIGAGEQEQARYYTKKILRLGHILVFTLFGCVFLLRHQLVRLFDFGPEALELAAYYTGAGAVLTMCAFYGNAFLPVAAFRSAGDVRYAVIMAVSTMFAFRVGLSYLLNAVTDLGLMCVWLGMFADWCCRGILNTIRFRSGKWLHKRLI